MTRYIEELVSQQVRRSELARSKEISVVRTALRQFGGHHIAAYGQRSAGDCR